jgi:cytochrome c nitrite reductase small subunit
VRLSLGTLALGTAVLVGIAVGVSTFTFQYAEGFSYLSNDPKACVNCHIMRPQYEGWQKGSHHAVATCNDCHVRHGLVTKWIDKSVNGYHHSSAFTLQNFHEPIMIGQRNAEILQSNCLRCHSGLVGNITHGGRSTDLNVIRCTQCHRGVGHGD